MEEKEINEVNLTEEKDYKDLYLRLYADFDNFKKRSIREKDELKKRIKIDTLSSVLELDNDLFLASKLMKDDKSIKIMIDKLHNYLKSQGIEEIQTDKYDDDLHEVISVVNNGTNNIIDVVSKGYKMNGEVVKYPKVIISK